jgi:hypothetical protein
MNPPIHCEGAPRDLGLDQGVASRAVLRAAYARASRSERLAWRLGPLEACGARVTRDVARHFPRQAEALDGLSRGAGVPRAWLATRLAEAARDPARLGEGPGAAAAPAGGAPALLALRPPPGWLVRRSRPEGGIACLELAPPWFTGAVAALSEAGLAAAVVSHGSAPGACLAPAALLVQDALHRTESLAGALEWCLRRPAGGRATLLFADATGEVAGLRVEGDARRVLRPAGGLLVAASGPARISEVVKAVRGTGQPQAAELARALGGALVLDPAARRLAHHPGGGKPAQTQVLAD